MDAWLAAGARVVWVADPRDESVTVYQGDRAPRRLAEGDTLDGAPLLPGFRLSVDDVFTLQDYRIRTPTLVEHGSRLTPS